MESPLEKSSSVDQKRTAILRRVAGLGPQLKRQGTIQASYRQYRGKRLGPYHRLTYRASGRQQSIYLGQDAALVHAVRRLLLKYQAPRRDMLRCRRLCRAIRKQLRRSLADLNRELQYHGLRCQGTEIRGWRNRRRGMSPASCHHSHQEINA